MLKIYNQINVEFAALYAHFRCLAAEVPCAEKVLSRKKKHILSQISGRAFHSSAKCQVRITKDCVVSNLIILETQAVKRCLEEYFCCAVRGEPVV
jgi:hypothetical protein